MRHVSVLQFVVALLLVSGLLISVEVGYRIGQYRMRRLEVSKSFEAGTIQGAMLGLLGLLLAFSFAGAAGRFAERQDLICREANAIGTAYLRAELLDEPYASNLKEALVAYLDHRVELSRSLKLGFSAAAADEVARHHQRIWQTARAGVEARPQTMILVIGSANEVIDLHATRIAAGRKHLPGLVLALLASCSVLTLGIMGFAGALGRQRNTVMTSAIAILIGVSLWTTIDLDWPRIGMIQVSDAPLIELRATMPGG